MTDRILKQVAAFRNPLFTHVTHLRDPIPTARGIGGALFI
jgi:hypothetical protein